MISIKPLNKNNWNIVRKLELREDQRDFLPPNVVSIAQSKVYPDDIPEVIYSGEEVVGFILSGVQDDGKFFILRFMLDKECQGRGLGTDALSLFLSKSSATEIYTSVEPENTVAHSFFIKCGFKDTGELDHGEKVLVFKK